MSVPLSFEVLGPIRVHRGGAELPIGTGQRRALLAILILHRGSAVGVETLIDGLWGEKPPPTARTALQVHVSTLRKALEDREGGVLRTAGNGYVLEVEPDQIDLDRFERLVEDGRAALADAEPDRARGLLDAALSLWRGVPFEGIDIDAVRDGDVRILEERRDDALAMRIEADLALGRHREVVPELERLCAAHPLHDRYAELDAIALYRSGRPADALAAIARLRRSLSQELGLDAGASVDQLEQAILRADPSLDASIPVVAETPRETRKVVSAVRFRLDGPTDPEARRARVDAVGASMREVVERLGGTIEDGSPGRLSALFGVPSVHEDDATRAVRAAWELRERATGEPSLRIGVATGEVLVETEGDRHRLLSTDVLDLADAFAIAGQPGDILIAQATYRLARSVAAVEPHEVTNLGDQPGATLAFRLKELAPEHEGHRLRAPLVGREEELAAIHQSFARARDERRPQLVAVLGAAGLGKTRLAEAATAPLGARVATGRCIPYGRDITFWPAAEVIREIAEVTDDDPMSRVHEKIRSFVGQDEDGDFLTRQLGAILGIGDEPPAPDELFWAVRRFLEIAAATQPLVVVVEDVHWADDLLLDLLEYLSTTARDASLLLLCLARPELMERRSSFGARQDAVILWLSPLPAEASAELVRHMLGEADLDLDARDRLMETADGNPLFLEELLSMLIDDGFLEHHEGRWRARGDLASVPLPPTVRALLEARLDRLPPQERAVLETAAVVGRSFTERDLSDLRPDEDPAWRAARLDALARKDLVAVDRYSRAGGRSYGFHHILMRDAVYFAVPKERRAADHERFGEALEHRSGDRLGELEEIVGYHLETAWHLRTELGRQAGDLGSRAALHLASAGHRALVRDDANAAASLFARARACREPDDPANAELALYEAIAAFRLGRFDDAQEALAAGLALVERTGDASLRWRLMLEQQEIGSYHRPDDHSVEAARAVAVDAIDALQALGDTVGLARAYRLLGDVYVRAGRIDDALEAFATGRGATDARDALERLEHPLMGAVHGSMPLDRYVVEAERYLQEVPRASPESLARLGLAYAMGGRRSEAEDTLARGIARARDVGGAFRVADAEVHEGFACLFMGEDERAVRVLEDAVALLEGIDERSVRSTALALLAEARFRTGALDAAEAAAGESRRLTADDDLASQIAWRGITAKVLSARGDDAGAISLAREATELADGTEFLAIAAQAHADLASVLAATGLDAEAEIERTTAADLFDRKGVAAGS